MLRDDDDTNDETDDDTADGGQGNRRPLLGGAIHFPPRGEWGSYKFSGSGSRVGEQQLFPQQLVEGLLNFRRRVCRSFWLDLAFQDPPGKTDQC